MINITSQHIMLNIIESFFCEMQPLTTNAEFSINQISNKINFKNTIYMKFPKEIIYSIITELIDVKII